MAKWVIRVSPEFLAEPWIGTRLLGWLGPWLPWRLLGWLSEQSPVCWPDLVSWKLDGKWPVTGLWRRSAICAYDESQCGQCWCGKYPQTEDLRVREVPR